MSAAETTARRFYETHSRLAAERGQQARPGWDQLPEASRDLMVASLAEVLRELCDRVDELEAHVQHLLTGPLDVDVKEILEHWVRATGRNPARTLFTKDRVAKTRARLREGMPRDLHEAIGGAAAGAHRSERGIAYDDIATIFQNRGKVELNMERYDRLVRHAPARGDSIGRKLVDG